MPAVDCDIPDEAAPPPPSRRGLAVTFYKKVIRDEPETKKSGMVVHRATEFVRILIAGDKTSIVDREVRPEDKRQFHAEYQAFIENRDQDEAAGLLLRLWPGIPETVAADIQVRSRNTIRTVESLADTDDVRLQELGPGVLKYRTKAREFIAAQKSNAPVSQLQEQLAKERREREALESKVAALEQAQRKAK